MVTRANKSDTEVVFPEHKDVVNTRERNPSLQCLTEPDYSEISINEKKKNRFGFEKDVGQKRLALVLLNRVHQKLPIQKYLLLDGLFFHDKTQKIGNCYHEDSGWSNFTHDLKIRLKHQLHFLNNWFHES